MLNIGFDLDGVLVNDLSAEAFSTKNIYQSLRHRQFTTPFFSVNSLLSYLKAHSATGVLVTARPNQDENDTRAWAKANNIDLDIVFGGHSTHLNTEDAAKFKVGVIKHLNLHAFFESDLGQVQLIREACPSVQVVCVPLFVEQALAYSIAQGV